MSGPRPHNRWSAVQAFSLSGGSGARRDKKLVTGLFLLPVAVMAVIGAAMQGYSDPMFTVGVLDAAHTASSRAYIARVDADPIIRVRHYRDEEKMRSSVYRGRCLAGILIPAGWEGKRGSELGIYLTGTTTGQTVVRALLEAGLDELGLQAADGQGVGLEVLGGGRLAPVPVGIAYTAPANLVLFVMITGFMSAAGPLLMRQRGLAKRLLATPASSAELYAGLAIPPLQVMIVQATFLIVSSWLAFDLDWGSVPGVIATTLALVAVGIAFMLLASTLFRTAEQVTAFGPLVAIVIGMLGGCFWPLIDVSEPVRQVGHLLPSAWAMDAYLALSFESASLGDVLPNIGILLAMAAGLTALGLSRMRSRFSR
jgi:ABC-2 type transport system permease protein